MASTSENSAALTLMSADVERILKECLSIHEFWANGIQIEPSSVGPLTVVGFCVVSTSDLMRFIGPRERAWMQAAQKRVSLTVSVIGQSKNIKISYLQSQD
ncbi:ABC transporter atnG [Metarhizium anisopliae]